MNSRLVSANIKIRMASQHLLKTNIQLILKAKGTVGPQENNFERPVLLATRPYDWGGRSPETAAMRMTYSAKPHR